MGDVITDFMHLFRSRPRIMPAVQDEASLREIEQKRRFEVEDARTALGTQFMKEYRDALEYEIEQLTPDPLLGTDVGACVVFKRSGLERARSILDQMKRLAEEKISNA